MTISSFEDLGVRFELSSVEEIANQKSKDTLLPQTFKVEEKKVSLVF